MLELNKIYCGDCLELMKLIPDKSIDLVLTDPPYNASNSNIGFGDKLYKTVNEDWDKGFTLEYLKECKRVLKVGGSALLFCSYHLLGDYLNTDLFKVQQIIHWIKDNPFPAIAKIYTPNVEYVVWYINGNPYTFNKKGSGQNIIKSPICAGEEREEHPTQKPLQIIKKLLSIHSNEGMTILDPFLGSGTTAIACKQMGRNFIGIEKEQKYVDIANKRLQYSQVGLF